MIPEQNLVEFPTFANNGTKVKPEAEKYDGGYVPADVLPAQHANWLFNKTSAAITELNAAVESVSEEIRNIVEAGGATPSEDDNLQSLTAIRYLISEAETRAKALGNATGTLAIAHGGTGATTAAAAQVNLFPDENTTDLTEKDFLVTGAANSNGEFSDTKHLFRTKLSKIWNYIKNKIAGITDSEPTAGSLNLVTSGSIKAKLDEKVNPPTAVTQAQYDSMTPAQRAGKYWIITDAVGSDQPMIRDDVKSTTSVWSSTKTDNTINNALANYVSKGELPDGFDINTIDFTSMYYVSEGINTPNESSTYGYLQTIVKELNKSYRKQIFSPLNTNTLYIRLCNNGTWTDWEQVETKKLILSGNTGQSTYYDYSFDSLDNGLYEVDYHFGSIPTELSGIVVFAKLNEYSGVSGEPQIIIATNGRTVNKTQIISNTWNDGVTLFKIR